MKSLALLFCWGFTFFAYSLVLAYGDTFFVAQAGHLRDITGNDLSILFIIRSIISDILAILFWPFGTIFERMRLVKMAKNWVINKFGNATIFKISVGMICALICCILAWHVEVQRLYLIKTEGILQNPDGGNVSMSTLVLIPQFVMLGLAEFLAEDGLKELFHVYTSKTMRAFDESFCQLVFGIGKLFTIPAILIFKGWFPKSSNTSRLDKYYLSLAILNIVFLLLFEFYYFWYAYKREYPEDGEIIVMEQTSQHVHQQQQEEEEERSSGFEEDEETVMKQHFEHAHQAASEEEVILMNMDRPVVSEGESDGRNLSRTLSFRRSKSKRENLTIWEEPTIVEGNSSLENNDQYM